MYRERDLLVQKVQVILEDGFTGGPADENVRFCVDGRNYEMELSAENAAALREAIEPFRKKGRKINTVSKSGISRPHKAPKRGRNTSG